MLIDGEKWACEACVRGHRVSSCRHHDRPLIRINKKGRPFSVCIICRGPCKEREEHSKLNRDKKSDGESDSKSSGKKPTARRRTRPSSFAHIAPHPAAPLPSSCEPFTTSQSRQIQSEPTRKQQAPPPLLPPLSAPPPPLPPLGALSNLPPTSSSPRSATTLAPTPPSTAMATPASNYHTLPPSVSSAPFSSSTYLPGSLLTAPLDAAAVVVTTAMDYPYMTLPIMEEPLLQPSSSSSSAYPFSDDLIFTSVSDGNFVPDSIYTGFEDVDALPEDWSTFFWNE